MGRAKDRGTRSSGLLVSRPTGREGDRTLPYSDELVLHRDPTFTYPPLDRLPTPGEVAENRPARPWRKLDFQLDDFNSFYGNGVDRTLDSCCHVAATDPGNS